MFLLFQFPWDKIPAADPGADHRPQNGQEKAEEYRHLKATQSQRIEHGHVLGVGAHPQ